jgi:hypothetical protein
MKNAETIGRHSLLVPGICILLLIGFPFFFFGGPGYHAARSFKAVWNLGHILFFFLATWLYLAFAGNHENRAGSRLFFFEVFFIVLLAGIVIELIQKALGGRIVDAGDIYRDGLGCVVAFVFTGSLPVTRKDHLLLGYAIVGLLFMAAWPVYRSLADEQTARSQFPLLADFETPFERWRFGDIRQLQREQKIARHGRYGLRVQLSTATYSGTSLFYFPHDWRNYRMLHFSIYNPENNNLTLHCRIHDTPHGQHGMRFDDRFHRRFELHFGWNDCSVALEDVQAAPTTRLMDMAQVESFAIFVVRQKRPRVLYLDNMYLSR